MGVGISYWQLLPLLPLDNRATNPRQRGVMKQYEPEDYNDLKEYHLRLLCPQHGISQVVEARMLAPILIDNAGKHLYFYDHDFTLACGCVRRGFLETKTYRRVVYELQNTA